MKAYQKAHQNFSIIFLNTKYQNAVEIEASSERTKSFGKHPKNKQLTLNEL
jgi:hypothetical protein